MQTTAQKLFRELKTDKWNPITLVVGEEPFQIDEIVQNFRKRFVKGNEDFNLDRFDGAEVDIDSLKESLETLPGLFDEPDSTRLVLCKNLEKIADSNLEKLFSFIENPSQSTCFLMIANKVNKRKKWYKTIDKHGNVVEVKEPYDRDWPKWQSFFQKRIKKTLAPDAWMALIDYSDRKLSFVWSEVQKLAMFVGDRKDIALDDINACITNNSVQSVFSFGEDVLRRNQYQATVRYRELLASGENEIKITSLLVRQFRLVWQCACFKESGIDDAKLLASELGAHPYFVTNLLSQSRKQSKEEIRTALNLLTECDFLMKTGKGNLFDNFLVPYFSKASA